MCNQMVTSEFYARFVNILIISLALRLRKLLEFNITQVKLFLMSRVYHLISWVTNYIHNRGVLTCVLYRELQALKSLKHTF